LAAIRRLASALPYFTRGRNQTVNATATGPSTRKRALVIDDDAHVRQALHDVVTGLGFHADAASNGSEGIARFESHPYDVVLTDLLMPGMTGWEVLKAVRERNPKIPVIIITGSAGHDNDRRVAQPGVALLHKPVRMDFLGSTLARVLGEKS
jgi:CheY-like chemotaxis protein